MGRSKIRGCCSCGYRYHRPSGDYLYFTDAGERTSTLVRNAIARSNVARLLPPVDGATFVGVAVCQAITENV